MKTTTFDVAAKHDHVATLASIFRRDGKRNLFTRYTRTIDGVDHITRNFSNGVKRAMSDGYELVPSADSDEAFRAFRHAMNDCFDYYGVGADFRLFDACKLRKDCGDHYETRYVVCGRMRIFVDGDARGFDFVACSGSYVWSMLVYYYTCGRTYLLTRKDAIYFTYVKSMRLGAFRDTGKLTYPVSDDTARAICEKTGYKHFDSCNYAADLTYPRTLAFCGTTCTISF